MFFITLQPCNIYLHKKCCKVAIVILLWGVYVLNRGKGDGRPAAVVLTQGDDFDALIVANIE